METSQNETQALQQDAWCPRQSLEFVFTDFVFTTERLFEASFNDFASLWCGWRIIESATPW